MFDIRSRFAWLERLGGNGGQRRQPFLESQRRDLGSAVACGFRGGRTPHHSETQMLAVPPKISVKGSGTAVRVMHDKGINGVVAKRSV
jgi:hypothetical protein